MSLHTLAQHLQSAGRGEDKVLVHMTPREVSGLQSLAMAHGGNLSINPQTGLPEAGFLSAILPMVAGAALNAVAPGLGTLGTAALVGGAGAIATGSLGKGLMMGLGAYGGAGLTNSLTTAAAPAAAPSAAAATNPIPTPASDAAASLGAKATNAATLQQAQNLAAGQAPALTMADVNRNILASPAFNPQAQPVSVEAATGAGRTSYGPGYVEGQTAVAPQPSKFDIAKGNIGRLFSGSEEDKKFQEDWWKQNKMPLIASGISALSLSREDPRFPKEQTNYQPINPTWNRMMQSSGNYQAGPYTGSSERRYFADGGLADLPVEQMSQQASTGENTNYPMANIRPYGYAVPRNVPISENVFKPVDYQRTDPYTGEQKFAEGGIASLVNMATGGFVSKLKAVAKPTQTQPKLQSTAAQDKTIKTLEKYSDLGQYQGTVNDLNSRIADLSKDKKANKTEIGNLQKELKTANAGLKSAQAYKSAVDARDKIVAANEAATNKAKDQFDSAMSKYNEYQDALAKEKQAWQEETGRKATGIQAIKPLTKTSSLGGGDVSAQIAALEAQKAAIPASGMGINQQVVAIDKQIADLKAGKSDAGFTPKYVKDKNGNTVLSSEVAPITQFQAYTKVPGYDTTKKLMEENDINAVFQDVAGRRASAEEMDKLLGGKYSDADIAKYAMNLPDVKAAVKYTDDDFKENFQYYMGRQPTSAELASMRKAKIGNFNQLRTFIQSQPAYLNNINAVAESQFKAQQKSAADALAEQERLAASLAPESVATAYKDVLGRAPTMEELNKYKGAQQTQEGLEGILKGSDEYLQSLTKPMVQQPTVATPKYAPGTVLEYTPEAQAQTGLGAITGGAQPTASGLQAPLTRGAVTLEGAMPLAPNFQEQLGIQTLASQAAEKAPALQTGMQFAAPQQNTFGFQPATSSPQSLEALLAALRAQQAQGTTTMADGGMTGYNLGGYSDGGRLLKGPGDGVSDSIPASIANKQPARLANNEFVIPARIVSEIGNGSTDAGARKLYEMMDRVQRRRAATVGKNKVAVDSKAYKELERL